MLAYDARKVFDHNLPSFADSLPWGVVVDSAPGEKGEVVCTKRGNLIASREFTGSDIFVEMDEIEAEINHLNEILARSDAGYSLNMRSYRRKSSDYPEDNCFPAVVTRMIEDERRWKYASEGDHYETHSVITFGYHEPSPATAKADTFFLPNRNVEPTTDARGSLGARALSKFYEKLEQFDMAMGRNYGLRPLGRRVTTDSQGNRLELNDHLSYLYYTATGIWAPIRHPREGVFIDSVLGNVSFADSNQGLLVGNKYVAVVGWLQYPSHSDVGMFNALNTLGMEFQYTTRAIFRGRQAHRKRISDQEKFWDQKTAGFFAAVRGQTGDRARGKVNQHAFDMMNEANAALKEVDKGEVAFCDYTGNVVIFADSPQEAHAKAMGVVNLVQHETGFLATIETEDQLGVAGRAAYFGQLPGELHANPRHAQLHTYNLAQMLPTNSTWSGPINHQSPMYPKNSAPLFYGTAVGRTPFRFHTHPDDCGHTMVIGSSGSGKSTFLSFMTAQFLRYPEAQVFCFDKGYSMFPLAAALSNEDVASHYTIQEGIDMGFCPLGRIDNAAECDWAAGWIKAVCDAAGLQLNFDQEADVANALRLLAGEPVRTLTNFRAKLRSKRVKQVIGALIDGPLGSLFNAEDDTVDELPVQVFEMAELMKMQPKWALPALQYLVHIVERRTFRRPTMVIFDEAWLMLESPYMQEVIKTWLKEMRKRNCFVVFATQQLTDLEKSSIGDVLFGECVTKVFLANPQADKGFGDDGSVKGITELYRRAGLYDFEISIIAKKMKKKRDYYFLSPLGRRPFSLELGAVALSFVGAANPDDLHDLRALMDEYPRTWVGKWLASRKCEDWADYYYRELGMSDDPELTAAPSINDEDAIDDDADAERHSDRDDDFNDDDMGEAA